MKLDWCPETATKAFLDTVETCKIVYNESSVAEMVSAMAAGWNAKLIVEAWSQGGMMATSIGLAIASHHSGGRHVCIVADEASRSKYIQAMEKAGKSPEVIVGEPEDAMNGLEGIDFMVVDCRCNDFARIFKVAKLGEKGAVLIRKNALAKAESDFRWRTALDAKARIVRSVLLPVGKGLDVAHVGARGGNSVPRKGERRWIKYIDRQTGEEFIIRK
ncbi:unnamed protein product [Coffea canephora]|uniref:Uncharacterized protein n=1 Tax=Coffea canephora TaxID=49390 RepID=A0A068UMX1_COFCA|nr:unnamed protein product [Coffea canephora]